MSAWTFDPGGITSNTDAVEFCQAHCGRRFTRRPHNADGATEHARLPAPPPPTCLALHLAGRPHSHCWAPSPKRRLGHHWCCPSQNSPPCWPSCWPSKAAGPRCASASSLSRATARQLPRRSMHQRRQGPAEQPGRRQGWPLRTSSRRRGCPWPQACLRKLPTRSCCRMARRQSRCCCRASWACPPMPLRAWKCCRWVSLHGTEGGPVFGCVG